MTIMVCLLRLNLVNGGGKMMKILKIKQSASEEALRKYYSVKEYVTHGTPRSMGPHHILEAFLPNMMIFLID